MKKLIKIIAAIKAIAMAAFTGGIMFLTVASMVLGSDSVPVGYIWQVVFLSLIFGALHLHAFSGHEAQRTNAHARIALVGVPMLIALSAFAYFFEWFPVSNLVNWGIFIGIYAGVFFIAVFALRTVFRLSGIKYNEMLAAYKASHEK